MAAPEVASGSCRLCVKNLPRYATEARLRESFASQGEVTDVKLLKTRYVRRPAPPLPPPLPPSHRTGLALSFKNP